MTVATQEACLTTDEVATRLRTSRRQVTILCAEGKLRASKSGRQWLIAEADLQDYLDATANRRRRRRARAT